MDSFKIIDAQETNICNKFKSARQQLLQTKVAICFIVIPRIYQLTSACVQSMEYVLLTNNKEQVKQKLTLTLILNDCTNYNYNHNYLLISISLQQHVSA